MIAARLTALLAFANFDKETLMLAALWAMVAAGAVVTVGAVVLFRREHRASRAAKAGRSERAAPADPAV